MDNETSRQTFSNEMPEPLDAHFFTAPEAETVKMENFQNWVREVLIPVAAVSTKEIALTPESPQIKKLLVHQNDFLTDAPLLAEAKTFVVNTIFQLMERTSDPWEQGEALNNLILSLKRLNRPDQLQAFLSNPPQP